MALLLVLVVVNVAKVYVCFEPGPDQWWLSWPRDNVRRDYALALERISLISWYSFYAIAVLCLCQLVTRSVRAVRREAPGRLLLYDIALWVCLLGVGYFVLVTSWDGLVP